MLQRYSGNYRKRNFSEKIKIIYHTSRKPVNGKLKNAKYVAYKFKLEEKNQQR